MGVGQSTDCGLWAGWIYTGLRCYERSASCYIDGWAVFYFVDIFLLLFFSYFSLTYESDLYMGCNQAFVPLGGLLGPDGICFLIPSFFYFFFLFPVIAL